MTTADQRIGTMGGDPDEAINLSAAAARLLESARAAHAGRAGHTLTPGAGAPLKQTLLGLVKGQSLADHDSPGAATLQVVTGVVRLTTPNHEGRELRTGDLAAIPPARHGLQALEDAVVLVSVAQESRP